MADVVSCNRDGNKAIELEARNKIQEVLREKREKEKSRNRGCCNNIKYTFSAAKTQSTAEDMLRE